MKKADLGKHCLLLYRPLVSQMTSRSNTMVKEQNDTYLLLFNVIFNVTGKYNPVVYTSHF